MPPQGTYTTLPAASVMSVIAYCLNAIWAMDEVQLATDKVDRQFVYYVDSDI
jgi:hypothetical protein